MNYNHVVTISDSNQVKKQLPNQGIIIIHCDGNYMTTLEECYSELSKQLNFPEYFGQNMNALNDMLLDLSWLTFNEIILLIENEFSLMARDDQGDKEALLNLLEATGEYWSLPIRSGGVLDRDALKFTTFLSN